MCDRVPGVAALLFGSLMLWSCSNPETQKLRHVEQGDKYAAEKRDEFAVVEYASAVKIDPKFGEARLKLLVDPTHGRDRRIVVRMHLCDVEEGLGSSRPARSCCGARCHA